MNFYELNLCLGCYASSIRFSKIRIGDDNSGVKNLIMLAYIIRACKLSMKYNMLAHLLRQLQINMQFFYKNKSFYYSIIQTGSSSNALNSDMNAAPRAPSITLWSADKVQVINVAMLN